MPKVVTKGLFHGGLFIVFRNQSLKWKVLTASRTGGAGLLMKPHPVDIAVGLGASVLESRAN
jgi:hypothetical protein